MKHPYSRAVWKMYTILGVKFCLIIRIFTLNFFSDKCHSELSTAADGYDSRLATGHLI